MVPTPDGALLFVVAWQPDGERLLSVEIGPDGEPRGELTGGDACASIAGLTPHLPPRPSDDPADEDRAEDGGWRVEIDRRDGVSTVTAIDPSGRRVTVFHAFGTAAAAAVAAVEDGAWVAFHHNVREDRPETDLAKWIALRFVDDEGRVHAPDAPMTDRDRDREGEEQSFEFPAIAIGPDGALRIFGRGSHRFWYQDVSGSGFAPRVGLDEGIWGCRGRRVSVATLSDGHLLAARREKPGVVVERLAPPLGGRVPLRPAEVRPAVRRPTVELVDEARDPARRDGRRTLFGDIHQHSAHSDGIGTADEPYLRARYEYGDDFCALTDHESFIGKRIGPGEWAHLCRVAERHDEPGRFATLYAYEWTGRMYPGPGHKVVYMPGPGLPVISRDEVTVGAEVVARAKALGGFAVPHHVGWTGADEDGHDPVGQPVWEICSCHGCYEMADHPLGQRGERRDQMAHAMLQRGHRFGFIACSDGHGLLYHHGVARKRDPFRTGVTAVQATACTREAIMSAIRERRCYATSGVKILLDLRAADRPMGSDLGAVGRVPVRLEATGVRDIARLELVGPDGVVAASTPEARHAVLEAEVEERFVYGRVVQQDGEMAWSSPVFWG